MGMGGMSALTGLGGYVGLGGKTVVPVGTSMLGGEVLLAKDGETPAPSAMNLSLTGAVDVGIFLSGDGTYTRQESLQWPGPPEALREHGIAGDDPY